MNRPENKLADLARWALIGALALGGFGCELIASVDRNKIEGTGSSGTGGAGGAAPECAAPADCPDTGNECLSRTCDAGKCGTSPVAAKTALAAQTMGDCKVKQCDGAGMTIEANDDLDITDDKNACTDDTCTGGVLSHKGSAAGTACGVGLVCDGEGACVGCPAAADCPGQDDDCEKRTCTAGMCGFDFTAAGTKTTTQVAKDCKSAVCDGSGKVITNADPADLPVDGNDCTEDLCTADVPSNPPSAAGAVCASAGGTVCNGASACVACLTAATCPGVDNDCQARTCTAGMCGISFVAAGTATATQTPHDCKTSKCDGAGVSSPVNDSLDLPDDSNPCTNDICTAGVPSHTPAGSGTVCGAGLVCDAVGACTGCVTAATCPGTDTECQTRTCTATVCGFSFTAAGTAVAMQSAGDCKKNTCNGSGAIVSGNDNSDIPVDATNCTNDICTGGVPSHTPTAAGSACADSGGTVCTGAGACVQCLVASTCPGVDTDCKVRTCSAGLCGSSNTALGTVTSSQTAGDCKENQCDGNGSSAPVTKNVDLPVDGNQCTSDVCTAGAPTNPPTASGTACNQMGGAFCNGASVCVQCITGANCPSGVCTGNICQAPTCSDNVKNGNETGQDCGGGMCPGCATGGACTVPADCLGGICTNSVCTQVNGCDFSNAVDITGAAFASVGFGGGLGLIYSPKCLKVDVGTIVTFNGDFSGHPLLGGVVQGAVEVPDSSGPFVPVTNTVGLMTKDFTMTAAGTFPYYCVPHGTIGMNGAVFVVP
jgi:plastocyanin